MLVTCQQGGFFALMAWYYQPIPGVGGSLTYGTLGENLNSLNIFALGVLLVATIYSQVPPKWHALSPNGAPPSLAR